MLQLEYGLLHIVVLIIAHLRETKCSESSYWLRVSDTRSKELNSLMATGRNDFLWRSVVHLTGIRLELNVLLWLTTTSWSAWEPFAKMTSNLDSILLSDTTVTESSSDPTMSCDAVGVMWCDVMWCDMMFIHIAFKLAVLQMFWYSLFLCPIVATWIRPLLLIYTCVLLFYQVGLAGIQYDKECHHFISCTRKIPLVLALTHLLAYRLRL